VLWVGLYQVKGFVSSISGYLFAVYLSYSFLFHLHLTKELHLTQVAHL